MYLFSKVELESRDYLALVLKIYCCNKKKSIYKLVQFHLNFYYFQANKTDIKSNFWNILIICKYFNKAFYKRQELY